MATRPDKSRILWPVLLAGVVAVLMVYRTGFRALGPGPEDKAVVFFEDDPQQGAEKTSLPEADPDVPVQPPKERQYSSERPLYFRAVFGTEGKSSMLGVIDESDGTGAGYDVAYVDENMNSDLTDEAAKEFPRRERGKRKGEIEPRFEFRGPFGAEGVAEYALNIYSLARKVDESVRDDSYHFFWYLNASQWHYFFINGKMKLFSNAVDALKGTPVRLGGACKWKISGRSKDGKVLVSAGLKDSNGCTLRTVRRESKAVSPTLTLAQGGKVEAEQKMEFG